MKTCYLDFEVDYLIKYHLPDWEAMINRFLFSWRFACVCARHIQNPATDMGKTSEGRSLARKVIFYTSTPPRKSKSIDYLIFCHGREEYCHFAFKGSFSAVIFNAWQSQLYSRDGNRKTRAEKCSRKQN